MKQLRTLNLPSSTSIYTKHGMSIDALFQD